jgi:hypothetical protein
MRRMSYRIVRLFESHKPTSVILPPNERYARIEQSAILM